MVLHNGFENALLASLSPELLSARLRIISRLSQTLKFGLSAFITIPAQGASRSRTRHIVHRIAARHNWRSDCAHRLLSEITAGTDAYRGISAGPGVRLNHLNLPRVRC
jgi:hypothetical protein